MLFLVEILLGVVMTLFETDQFLVAPEFEKSMRPYAIAAALYVGASLLSGQIAMYKSWPTSSQPARAKKLKRERLSLIPITILVVGLTGWLAYFMTIELPARLLHQFATRQPVTLQATAVSVYDPRREYRRNCHYHLNFQSSLEQSNIPLSWYVCITAEQKWAYFRSLPRKIMLCGEQSAYGYRLHLCGVGN